MFWRVAGFTQPSPIETILDKENFTLEELLDEDDLIQVPHIDCVGPGKCWLVIDVPPGTQWCELIPSTAVV